jgi:pimeloyl-ACP methyl ester carboxylesterase
MRIGRSSIDGSRPVAASPPDLPIRHFEARDGTRLAYRELAPDGGGGRPLVLIHGFFSTAYVNWIRFGHVSRIVAQGYRVIMPDLRGHGDSARPHDPAAYPPDILVDDGFALIDHLGLTDYDLGGYSLGGRTVMRMLVQGATPGRAIVAGMGLGGILNARGRGGFFRNLLSNPGTFPRGSAEYMSEAFLKTVGGDPQALLLVLDSFTDTPRAALDGIDMPVLVLIGDQDDDNGSGAALAEALPHGELRIVPGTHMGAVTRRELGEAMADWLSA